MSRQESKALAPEACKSKAERLPLLVALAHLRHCLHIHARTISRLERTAKTYDSGRAALAIMGNIERSRQRQLGRERKRTNASKRACVYESASV
eukprot:6171844-Pleurochrysis_carterae.AAC.1